MEVEAIVIGASAGGFNVLRTLFRELKPDFAIPILIVQHLSPHNDSVMASILNGLTTIQVKEADDKDVIQRNFAYIAPPNFHMLVEYDRTISLNVEEKVCFSRPSVDVLFETASFVYEENLLGVLLTGANGDGAFGMRAIKQHGGITIAQNPDTAEVPEMPQAAIDHGAVDYIFDLERIISYLNGL